MLDERPLRARAEAATGRPIEAASPARIHRDGVSVGTSGLLCAVNGALVFVEEARASATPVWVLPGSEVRAPTLEGSVLGAVLRFRTDAGGTVELRGIDQARLTALLASAGVPEPESHYAPAARSPGYSSFEIYDAGGTGSAMESAIGLTAGDAAAVIGAGGIVGSHSLLETSIGSSSPGSASYAGALSLIETSIGSPSFIETSIGASYDSGSPSHGEAAMGGITDILASSLTTAIPISRDTWIESDVNALPELPTEHEHGAAGAELAVAPETRRPPPLPTQTTTPRPPPIPGQSRTPRPPPVPTRTEPARPPPVPTRAEAPRPPPLPDPALPNASSGHHPLLGPVDRITVRWRSGDFEISYGELIEGIANGTFGKGTKYRRAGDLDDFLPIGESPYYRDYRPGAPASAAHATDSAPAARATDNAPAARATESAPAPAARAKRRPSRRWRIAGAITGAIIGVAILGDVEGFVGGIIFGYVIGQFID